MNKFATTDLVHASKVKAPDGSDVRILLSLSGGGMAHFELPANQVSHAVVHQTVEEIWYVVSGYGDMWRKQDDFESITSLAPGVCLTIPVGTCFQFRASAVEALCTITITMPPWPGEQEALFVEGPWKV